MFAKLTALVGGGFVLPYTLEEPCSGSWGSWTHYKGKSKDDGSLVSVFKISSADVPEPILSCAKNGVRRLKMLRHPNILTFKDTFETTDKGCTIIYLITEPVRPLLPILEELNLSGQERGEYISMGLLQVTRAISFLNNDCKLIHGNICAAAVTVTETLDWKLHAFDLLSEHALPYDSALRAGAMMVANQYKPGEYGRAEWEAVQQSPPWAIDAWGLGCLIQEAFSGSVLPAVDKLRDTSCIPPQLLGDYQRLLSSAPARRQNPSKLATEGPLLQNRLVDTFSFLENIAVKDSTDKESFFRKLPQVLPSVPQEVTIRKLLPLLTAAMEFGGAPAAAVSGLLWIGERIKEDADFNRRVVPSLAKLFASPDRLLRRALLEQVDAYAPRLSPAAAEELIYPNLQAGFVDAQPYIREMTLKSILSLAPKLSNKTLVQSVLKHLNKSQTDEEPSIRANTTVLLGCLAPSLGEVACRRVLLNAFSRALRDPFPPARAAGLKALIATKATYSAEDIAVRMLPIVIPLCMEAITEVRAAALLCADTFMAVLHEEHEKRSREATAAGIGGASQDGGAGVSSSVAASSSSSGGGNSIGNGISNNSNSIMTNVTASTSLTGAAASTGSSMLTWAVSSLIGAATTAASAASTSSSSSTPTSSMSAALSASSSAVSYSSGSQPSPDVKLPLPKAPVARQNHPPSTPTASEGWDDDEDELDLDMKEEEEARRRLRNLTVSSSTTAAAAAAAPPAPAISPAVAASSSLPPASSFATSQSLSSLSSIGRPNLGMDLLDAELAKAEASNPGSTFKRQSSALAGVRRGVVTRPVSGADGAKKLGAMKLGVNKLTSAGSSSGHLNTLGDDW